jgi:hypothetical protein
MRNPSFSFHFLDIDGARIFGFTKGLRLAEGQPDVLRAGGRALIAGEVENRLLPGRYHIDCWVTRNRAGGDIALHALRLLEFSVYGTEIGAGSVALNNDVSARIVPPGTQT